MSASIQLPDQEAWNAKYRVNEDGILRLVSKIAEDVKPIRVVAFGSRARGTHRPDSDLDLAVIVEDAKRDEELVRQARSQARVFFPVDLLVINHARQEWMKDSIVSVEHEIDQEGVVLYDQTDRGPYHGTAARLSR